MQILSSVISSGKKKKLSSLILESAGYSLDPDVQTPLLWVVPQPAPALPSGLGAQSVLP